MTANPAVGRCCDECAAERPQTVAVTTSATTQINAPATTTKTTDETTLLSDGWLFKPSSTVMISVASSSVTIEILTIVVGVFVVLVN